MSDLGEVGDEEPAANDPTELPDDEPAAPGPASPLPVDQQALNIVGLAQARERLRAARSRREHSDDPPATEEDDEVQGSIDRHPAGQPRRRKQPPS